MRAGIMTGAAVVGLAILAAACTTPSGPALSPEASSATPQMAAETRFTMNSWGQPLAAWSVKPDGSGTWADSQPRNGNFTDRMIILHTLPADPAAAAALAQILARLPATPPTADGCRERITDQPYGELILPRSAGTTTYRYDAGCLDAPYAAYIQVLRQANEHVAARGRVAPVSPPQPPPEGPRQINR